MSTTSMSPAGTPPAPPQYKKSDFVSSQEVRWCPGCGDYAILSTAQTVLAGLGIPREKIVIVSGIGCSSRFPYYVNSYGFHSIHGRAPAVATGVKVANPDLSVWVVTGDGDGLSIGGNHLLHTLRRNVDLKILLFNNRIYGLTKGQYSPTSEIGKVTKSTPFGSVDRPIDPISIALASGATFVARSADVFRAHLSEILVQAAEHRGSAFVEIFQNCNIFNDGAFEAVTAKTSREEKVLELEHGKPLVFGHKRDKGVRLVKNQLEVVSLAGSSGNGDASGNGGGGVSENDLLVWDQEEPSGMLSFLVNHHTDNSEFPTPIGVFRKWSAPTFDAAMNAQVRAHVEKRGKGDLEKLLHSGVTWKVD